MQICINILPFSCHPLAGESKRVDLLCVLCEKLCVLRVKKIIKHLNTKNSKNKTQRATKKANDNRTDDPVCSLTYVKELLFQISDTFKVSDI